LAAQRVDEPVVVYVARQHGLLLAGLAGDRGRAGVGFTGSGVDVAGGVVAELGKHPGAEHDAKAGLAQIDLSVRVLAKMRLDLAFHVLVSVLRVVRMATWARTVAA
jgi:hypothetical protein